ncbi:MAG: 16S rRNA (cytidine(1402)-2'-O)-methyltransferase [Clostridiales bacterium]|nr:16S rRNA (cytidine(1402)-2'-O)-methyltransferase [Clostridiales bacterium]
MSKLYIVGTPIGNLNDISMRALDTLSSVNFIAAEDTRVTLKLLNKYNIKNTLLSYHEHNKNEMGEKIVSRIMNGESCALVTDAGMPAISDPGVDLVNLCYENNIKVESVPGPTAVTTALALSGFDTRRFVFEGFLPQDKEEKKMVLLDIKGEKRTVVFYEAPHRFHKTLKDIFDITGERDIAIVREITKIHEEVIRTKLSQACEMYSKTEIKGEIVLIIAGCKESQHGMNTLSEAVDYAFSLINDGESKSNAAKIAAQESGFKKGDIYSMLIKMP